MTAQIMPIPAGLQAPGTSSGRFEPVARIDDIGPGEMRRVSRADVDLLIVHTGRGICVTDDRCPHMAAPLSLGALDECLIACPLHRGQFDLVTGDVVQFPTTGGLGWDGATHDPWSPPDSAPKPAPTDLKARARAATRIRRLRYYPVRFNGDTIEVAFPE